MLRGQEAPCASSTGQGRKADHEQGRVACAREIQRIAAYFWGQSTERQPNLQRAIDMVTKQQYQDALAFLEQNRCDGRPLLTIWEHRVV